MYYSSSLEVKVPTNKWSTYCEITFCRQRLYKSYPLTNLIRAPHRVPRWWAGVRDRPSQIISIVLDHGHCVSVMSWTTICISACKLYVVACTKNKQPAASSERAAARDRPTSDTPRSTSRSPFASRAVALQSRKRKRRRWSCIPRYCYFLRRMNFCACGLCYVF